MSSKEETTPRSSLTSIGQWRLGATLGRGAYGHVRLATHVTGRKAACKILPALSRDNRPVTWDQTVDAIEAHKEVVLLKALSGLKMPGVVELEGIVERDGWTYIFSTLHPYSAAHVDEPWPHDQLVTFFRRLCMTVHSLHGLRISHEDLKRSNVLVDRLGCPSIIDFGFSHFVPHGQRVKSAGGTLDYSSPEKVADGMYDGFKNDIWSLGIFLCKILNIPHPFINFTVDSESFAKRKISAGKADFRFQRHHIGPGRAASLIAQMLERKPHQRITIPEILEHPFLLPDRPDPHPFHLPSFELPSKMLWKLPSGIILDLCFLAYLNQEFFLCQTSKDVVDRLYGPEPCWEKRWAKMLSRWKEREDMEWEDIPKAKPAARSMIPVRAGPRRAVLQDIAPNSRINAGSLVHNKANALLPPSAEAKHAHESIVRSNGYESGIFNDAHQYNRVKRVKKLPGLSPKKGVLPTLDQALQFRSRRFTTLNSQNQASDRFSRRQLHTPREARRPRDISVLSDESAPLGLPVLKPTIPETDLITLDSVATRNPTHPGPLECPPGDLLEGSVEVMRDLALDTLAESSKASTAPRRSSRIAMKQKSGVNR